jgi:hypothetical protein
MTTPRATNHWLAQIVAQRGDWCVVEVAGGRSRYVMPVSEAEDEGLALDNREHLTTRAEALALVEHLAAIDATRALAVLKRRRDRANG